jgi:CBS domain-containing protein
VTKIRDVMTPDVVAVTPSTTLMDAAKTMIEQEKGPLPVVEGDRPVGMITDRDLVARVVAPGYDPRPLTVADVATNMTARDLVTARPDQDLEEARALLARHQLDRLLVVEGNRLVGILSEADIRADEGPLDTAAMTTGRRARARAGARRAALGFPTMLMSGALGSLAVTRVVTLIRARAQKKRSPQVRLAGGGALSAAAGAGAGVTYLVTSGKLKPMVDRLTKRTRPSGDRAGASVNEPAPEIPTPEEPPPPPGPIVT